MLCLKAKGQLDPFGISYICDKLNQIQNLELTSCMFALFTKQSLIYTQSYADRIHEIYEEMHEV